MVQRYIAQCKGRQGTKKARYTNIRSFFLHNRAGLPRDGSFRIRSEVAPVRGTLTVEEIKRTIMGCNKAYQAIYLVMFQGALDRDSFIQWNNTGYESLMQQLRDNPETIKIDVARRKATKNIRPFYTFIGNDAIQALRNWLQIRPENAKTIITNQYGNPLRKVDLTQYWITQLRKQGIVKHKKGRPCTHRTGKTYTRCVMYGAAYGVKAEQITM